MLRLSNYRAPLIAGMVLISCLIFWASVEWSALQARHLAEMRRFADGIFLALDVSHATTLRRRPDGPEALPETPSRLQIATEARSAPSQVLEVEGLRPRPSGGTSRAPSQFSQREGFRPGLWA